MCSNREVEQKILKSVVSNTQPRIHDEENVARASSAREQASTSREPDDQPKSNDDEVPPKKRRTRRGRRRHPYLKSLGERKNSGEAEKVVKPEAPHNSNQFLIEDHGNPQEIDQRLRNENHAGRARDSSFSVDSDAENYSSPEDEEDFLQKDFDDTYENLRVERLNMLSKSELINEFVQQERRYELKRRPRPATDTEIYRYKKELNRLSIENELLRKENKQLRSKLFGSSDSDSVDSESDSSTSCTTCSEHSESREIDYEKTNGHSSPAS